ncbi:MAG: F0F1 ATP synthase subunit B [Phycisphaerales bacterium]|nr:F0F1 ATP synthase subunit B [Phycisphaerales bacterium]
MKRLAFLLILLALAGLSVQSFASDPVHEAEAELHNIAEEATGHDAHGADHGGEHKASVIESPKAGIAPMITAILVFMIVAGILAVGVWPKIVKGLDERNEKIQGEIAAAEAARKQAKDALNEYEKNLAEARAEAQQMLADTKAQQSELAAQLKAQADTELSAMREKAKADIDAAKKQALNELYSESVNLATVMAGKILQREVTANDQQRLMEESLHEMKTAKS